MGRQTKSKLSTARATTSARAKAARPSPHPKKARVDVRFEGGPVKELNGSTGPVKSVFIIPSLSKAKGKAKAIEVPIDANPAALTQSISPYTPSASTFVIIAGSYEKLLYGLEGSFEAGSSKPTLKPIFIFPAHLACVKAIAASPGGKWLATGSEDEFVKVWDLRRRKEVGSLSQHEGSITSLHFPSSSHLVTSSVDGTLSLFRTSDWALLKSLKGHSGRVNHVDVHPTGRVALSVGKDGTLRMWDLMRGRGAASLPLGMEAEQVKFSPLGTHFAVLFPKQIQIYTLNLKMVSTLTTTSRFNSLLFASIPRNTEDVVDENREIEVLCVGTEKGVIEVYRVGILPEQDPASEDEDGESSEIVGTEFIQLGHLVGHANRIKSISSLPFLLPAASATGMLIMTTFLASVSSDGLINLYDLASFGTTSPSGNSEIRQTHPICSYDTKGSRLTCVFIADGKHAMLPRNVTGHINGNGSTAKDGLEDALNNQDSLGELANESDASGDELYESSIEADEFEKEDEVGMDVEFEGEDED